MPLEVYKVLGQVKSAGAGVQSTLYTVPANAMAKVYVTVSNAGSATHRFSIAISKNGAAAANGDYAYDSIDIAKNVEYTTATFTLAAGDVIRVSTNDGTDFTFQAHGVEIYTPAAGVYFDVVENGVTNTVRLYGLEQNLRWLYETDEDCLLRIGFNGYGQDNELTIDFRSRTDRAVFVQALEQARLYGNVNGQDPVSPMIWIGDNTTVGGTTTTSTTSTTTTTTAAPTTTTTTSTTSTSTTSTTAAPPTISWSFTKQSSVSAAFVIKVNGTTAVFVTSSGTGSINSPTVSNGDSIVAQIITGNTTTSEIEIFNITTSSIVDRSGPSSGGITMDASTISTGDSWRITADALSST